MSSRPRGFWAGLFGIARGERNASQPLFPPRPLPERGPLLPPAPLPAIASDSPRAERATPPLPPDVPPPATQPVAAPPTAAFEPPIGLATPSAAPPARPVALASLLADVPPLFAPTPRPLPPAADAPAEFVELPDLAAGARLATQPGFWGGELLRLPLAPSAPPPVAPPLVEGTEPFTDPGVIGWHGTKRDLPPSDIACYFATDVIVTGPGHIWIDGRLVTSPELMPVYVHRLHQIAEHGQRMLGVHGLPLREVTAPCVVLIGHGVQVYGHFLIEFLFRVLLIRRVLAGTGLPIRWLMDATAPSWFLRILHEDLGIPPEQLELFDPTTERVRVRQAILPGLVHQEQGFHPFTAELLADFLASLGPLPPVPAAPRLFVARRGYKNPHSGHRECLNEEALAALAEARGFTPVAAEELPWRQQLALFRQAEIVLGTFGSGLHTALVSHRGTRVGAVGLLNSTQTQIAALCGHRMAYFNLGFELKGQFTVPEERFARFLDALCGETAATAGAAIPSSPPPPETAALPHVALAAPAAPRQPGPLLPGTEAFAVASQRGLHREPRAVMPLEAICVRAADAVVGAAGAVWIEGAPLAAPELLPRPLAPRPSSEALPLRDIAEPCVVLAGQGIDTPSSFAIETLPRLLLARRAVQQAGERLHLLLDAASPEWLLHLLTQDIGFAETELVRFAPERERVRLRQAVLPSVLYRPGGFHPLVAALLDELFAGLGLPPVPSAPRLVLQRPPALGADPNAPRGDCRNEPALLALAVQRHGFATIAPDTLPWRERVARLRAAQVVLVAHGVGVHHQMLAGAGTRVGLIGARGPLPAEVAALREHRLAYLAEGVPPRGPFTLNESRFAEFLDALCDPAAEAAEAA